MYKEMDKVFKQYTEQKTDQTVHTKLLLFHKIQNQAKLICVTGQDSG